MIVRQPKVDFESFVIADVPCAPEPYHRLNRIPIIDNGEPLVDLRVTNPELSFGDYCLPYVRESVAQALKAATDRLPDHLDLRVFTALRTLEQQSEMYWGNFKRTQEAHPDWPESAVRRATNRFFAAPDAKAPPGHCTGGAVDVGLLLKETGEGIDVRSPIEGWKGAPTAVRGLSAVAADNRRLLCYLMHSTGLSNCRDEFWHWSYGDSAWAVRIGEPAACYGAIEPPTDATRVVGERVSLSPYDTAWPSQFETICEGLGFLGCRMEHVGSTSVPGLSAKPILDVDLVVDSDERMVEVIAALKGIGYEHQGDLGIAGREAFKPSDAAEWKDAPCRSWPRHHLYACVKDARELRRHLAFRDYLRANPVAARDYAALKSDLAACHPWDRLRYTEKKGPLVVGVLREVSPELLDPSELAD